MGTTIYYKKNGTVFYTSLIPSTTSLVADFSFAHPGGRLLEVTTHFSGLSETPIYGSSRLGQHTGGQAAGTLRLGLRQYELTNHLGNVLAVVTDNIRMIPDSTWAQVVQTNDYYAFGSAMPGRNFSSANYRYGFNGKEKDSNGEWGNIAYDFGARVYNPSIGRWFAPDPAFKDYVAYSPYNFGANNPIVNIDSDGKRIYFIPGLGYNPDMRNPEPYVTGVENSLYDYLKEHNTYSLTVVGSNPSNSKNGLVARIPDMKFVVNYGQKPALSVQSDIRIANVANVIAQDIINNPRNPGEQINILGTSQGSVSVAQASIFLLENSEQYGLGRDFKIDNLILAGSPVDIDSKLYAKLKDLESTGRIGKIHYDKYQSKNKKGNYNDQVTGLAGRSKFQAVRRGIGFLLDALLVRGKKHPHLKAAADKPTEEGYDSFGGQLKGQLEKDKIH
ncbi:MAG: hypothetical protein KF775_13895 [Cyclobacteriaceae bacterium]|nr:hypothetical protein [Cyclobacteriaceae bacterium]